MIAGKIIGDKNIYSFDANKHAFDVLNRNKLINNLPLINAYNYAVGDKSELVKITKINYPSPNAAVINKNNKKYTTVKAISLDDFFENKTKQPSVIKIDVEGFELSVLRGMKKLLKNDLIIFLELHSDSLDKFGNNPEDVLALLSDQGYNIYEIRDHTKQNANMSGRIRKINKNEKIKHNIMCYVSRNELKW